MGLLTTTPPSRQLRRGTPFLVALIMTVWVANDHFIKPLLISLKGPSLEHLAGHRDLAGATPEWATPLEFIQACEELDGAFPAAHESGLSILFNQTEGQQLPVEGVVEALYAHATHKALDKKKVATTGSKQPCIRRSAAHPGPSPDRKLKVGECQVC
jgi:hypothetical protein